MPTPTFEVLVADDDTDICNLLSEYFRTRGLSCKTHPDGRSAVRALAGSNGHYHLVVTDIGMPGADGFEVLAASRAANPNGHIVVMTGTTLPDTKTRAVLAGADTFLTKPFTLAQMDVVVAQAAERFASRPTI
jgi:CheY-like chemotaxis protein